MAVTRTSREMGEILGFAREGIRADFAKIKENLNARMSWIWDVDLLEEVKGGVEIARGELKKALL
jgi:salicylate hydroxylase